MEGYLEDNEPGRDLESDIEEDVDCPFFNID